MKARIPLLLSVLRAPDLTAGLSAAEWDLLIRQARRAMLLAKLAVLLEPRLQSIPAGPRHHLSAARLTARRQTKLMHWEVAQIHRALATTGVTPILLKGAAYLMADLPASQGRLFGDVDILVPKVHIQAVEAALIAHGWGFDPNLDDYDRRYYREWMHEIPPMGHEQRGSTLDVHHTILPPTARIAVNAAALFEGTRPLASQPGVRVLDPCAMFLHSAAHLFHEGELEKGLRDLFDLDALLRDFGRDPVFWRDLLPRARRLGLTRPLFYALRYTGHFLATPVPDDVRAAVQAEARPAAPLRVLMDFCYSRALLPDHDSCNARLTPLARALLYVRSHWLRMPTGLLLRHLLRKTWMRVTQAQRQSLAGATAAAEPEQR